MSRSVLHPYSIVLVFALIVGFPFFVLAGGSDAGGGGFDQALEFMRTHLKKSNKTSLPIESVQVVCERFMDEARDGLELLSLLLESGTLHDWDEPNLSRVESLRGTLLLNHDVLIDAKLFKAISETSHEICGSDFSINLDLKDDRDQRLVARNYPKGKIELNLEMLSTPSLETTCREKFANIDIKLCPFLLVKMIGAHELISRYDRRIESDGVYSLSSRLVSRLGGLRIGTDGGVFFSEDKMPESPLDSNFNVIYRALYSQFWRQRACHYLDSNYGEVFRRELGHLSKKNARKSITEKIQAMRNLMESTQRLSSLTDRAFDRPLNLGRELRQDLLNEIICLSTLLGHY